MTPLVKICGITSPEDAQSVLDLGADLIGFVFVAGTPRAIDPNRALWIREFSGRGSVGVFRDADLETVIDLRHRFGLDWVQLHGSEPDEWLPELDQKVIRRVGVDSGGPDWGRIEKLADSVLPLIDPGAGDGEVCDWGLLARMRPQRVRFGLAGGLQPGNVAAAVQILRPAMVDVSSGVERSPGIKDIDRVKAFIDHARRAAPARI